MELAWISVMDSFFWAAGDNAPDSEFLDPIRLDTNQDSDNLFGDLTKDSGVGRSPRAPGFGSDPRSQEESSMPPAWLQDVSGCLMNLNLLIFSLSFFPQCLDLLLC